MSEITEKVWSPPNKIEALYAANESKWAAINAPTAGARINKEVPVGNAKFQLYSLSTPNGHKPAILLEELGIDYDAHIINIAKGEQFISGFVDINPNSKIPAAVDYDGYNGEKVKLFESASIMLYLADKYKKFIPCDPNLRSQVINWLFWQVGGQGPMTGNFGHFFVYAPNNKCEARDYGVARFGMDVQRLCDVLNNQLKDKLYLVNNEYSIADMACFPWARAARQLYRHESGITSGEFLSIEEKYPFMCAWCNRIEERPAVKRGLQVCPWSDKYGSKPWLHPDNPDNQL